MPCKHICFVHPHTQIKFALSLLPEGGLGFVEEDQHDIHQLFNVEADGSLCPKALPTFSKTRCDMLAYLLQQHGLTQQNVNFIYNEAPAVASVTITNHTAYEITIYRIRHDGDGYGSLVGIVPSGFTVSISPLVLTTKLRAMNSIGNSWDFIVDDKAENWTLTPTGWIGTVGLPHSIVGEWIGYYEGCGEEIIKVELQGNQFVATKVTGDNFVPAGQITWRADLGSDAHILQGTGQLASPGFINPHFVTGKLTIVSEAQIIFSWDSVGQTTYHRYVQVCPPYQPHPTPIVCPPPPTPVVCPPKPVWGSNVLGQWIGYYPGCGDEIIQLSLVGDEIIATKVTGDNYIPAGQVTWKVRMTSPTCGTGSGQLAYPGFRNPSWQNGEMKIINENQISFGGPRWPKIVYHRKPC